MNEKTREFINRLEKKKYFYPMSDMNERLLSCIRYVRKNVDSNRRSWGFVKTLSASQLYTLYTLYAYISWHSSKKRNKFKKTN